MQVLPNRVHESPGCAAIVVCHGTSILLTGCSSPYSTLETAGPAAESLARLWWAMFFGGAAVTLLVVALLLLAFRRRATAQDIDERRWLIGGGLAFPGVVLVVLLVAGVILGERWLPRGAPSLVVHAEAERWQWTFRYAGLPLAPTTGELHIPAGEPVDIVVTTKDVIHSFWIPQLAGKIDAIPGHENRLRIEASRAGRFAGQCAEFCGPGHAIHGFAVVAHDEAAWTARTRP